MPGSFGEEPSTLGNSWISFKISSGSLIGLNGPWIFRTGKPQWQLVPLDLITKDTRIKPHKLIPTPGIGGTALARDIEPGWVVLSIKGIVFWG